MSTRSTHIQLSQAAACESFDSKSRHEIVNHACDKVVSDERQNENQIMFKSRNLTIWQNLHRVVSRESRITNRELRVGILPCART